MSNKPFSQDLIDPQTPSAPVKPSPTIPAELQLICNVLLTAIAGWVMVYTISHGEGTLYFYFVAVTASVAFVRNATKVVENWEEIG